MTSPTRVLIIEDDPAIRTAAAMFLEDYEYDVETAEDGEQGLKKIIQQCPDVVVTDIRMPNMNGFTLIKATNEQFPGLPIIVVSGTGDMNDVIKAMRFGVWDFILKPVADMNILRHSIEKCIEKMTLIKENQRHRELLETANKELKSFNYSVSHDLRNPLHAINAFSAMLEEDLADQLPPDSLDHLRRIRTAAARMDKMIQDLLALSRLNQASLSRTKVNLSQLVTEITDSITSLAGNDVPTHIEIQPDLVAFADEGLIRNVLENLLNNAWKYTRKNQTAHISFGQTEVDGKTAFFVKDDGAGFNMAHKEKLFGIFQRLHSDRDFPGTGIGLATVRRIINRHQGSIWATAVEGSGATFYFTL